MKALVAVLRSGIYLRLLAAAICAGVALWIFQTALYWAALQSGSTGTVGILLAVIALPSLLLTLPAGYLTDRAGSFWLLLAGQLAPTIACAAGAAVIASGGTFALEPAAVVTAVVGIAYALWNVPALVFVTRIVEPRHQGSAIALMVLQFAVGRICGGALGGLLVAVSGAGLAFAVSAALFAIGGLLVLTLPRVRGLETRSATSLHGIVEALGWLRGAPATLTLVALGALANMLAYAYIPLLGALSRDVIGAGSTGLGILTATSGCGMFIAALVTNTMGARLRRGRGLVVAMIAGAVAMGALGSSLLLPLSVVLVVCVAFFGSARASLAQFMLQSLAPPRMRGRVASLADFVGQATTILGTLAVGALAAAYGPTLVLLGCAVGIVSLVALAVFFSPRILALDVDGDAHPVLAGVPYVEGRMTTPAVDIV